jgi:hypothetical protein
LLFDNFLSVDGRGTEAALLGCFKGRPVYQRQGLAPKLSAPANSATRDAPAARRAPRIVGKTMAKSANPPAAAKKATSRKAKRPILLSGGNPQIAKGYGNAPVTAYIAALPDWKRKVGQRLDALIVGAVPNVKKAVKWNSPFYGVEEGVWFVSFHAFTNYMKVTFFRGASLDPLPPGASKHKDVRYLDVRESDLDETQFVAWVKQASRLPGEKL